MQLKQNIISLTKMSKTLIQFKSRLHTLRPIIPLKNNNNFLSTHCFYKYRTPCSISVWLHFLNSYFSCSSDDIKENIVHRPTYNFKTYVHRTHSTYFKKGMYIIAYIPDRKWFDVPTGFLKITTLFSFFGRGKLGFGKPNNWTKYYLNSDA